MSDSDDEFDREAEREKLREKYEKDKERREATERMSDLLLKGATMTNRHCGTCGSPVFRHEGQAFCPTCQEPVAEGDRQGAGQQGETRDRQTQQRAEQQDAGRQRSQQAPAESDSAGTADESARGPPTVDGDPSDARSTGAETPDRTPGTAETPDTSESAPARAGSDTAAPRDRPSAGQVRTPAGAAEAGDLGSVEASLTRTLSELVRQAEATDDLGRTRDYLATAREAAETLRAVRQAER